MRFVFFDDYRLGLIEGDAIRDVTPILGDAATLEAAGPQDRLLLLIAGLDAQRDNIARIAASGPPRRLAGARLRAPVPRPMKICCAARNYRENGTHESIPIEFFLKSPEAILEPDGIVELPPAEATIFHHEAELAVVIGRAARRVPASHALAYVFGYLPFVDVSARGLMPRSFFNGKSFDTFAPFGPAIVTADEVADPQRLTIALDVNDETRQRFGTDDMANSVAELIAYASSVTTLRPGDIVATGTNHQGLGALQDRDRVRLRIEDWPALTFSVRDPLGRTWARGVDEATAARARQPSA
ncbi:MAG: FAA hydrolase family protein [Chloroflexota bacterium]|nr:MAG: FAA hydrolase family protein [Chloroflexota bacterium]